MKFVKYSFILLFTCILLLPVCFINLQSNVASSLDNRMLAPLPTDLHHFRMDGETILKDRIGFRDTMLMLYQNLQYRLFGVLPHPLYMVGREGHVFYGFDAYVNDYQHRNVEPQQIAERVEKLEHMHTHLQAQGIGFLYALMPDKKTVYSEFYPHSIHQKPNPSFAQSIENALQNTNVPYFFAQDVLQNAKAVRPTYNKKFDAGHFNAFGAFVVQQALAQKMQAFYPEYQVPALTEFTESTTQIPLQKYIGIWEEEQVPSLVLNNRNFTVQKGTENDRFTYMAENKNAPIQNTLFVFGDSYFINCDAYAPTPTAIDYFAKNFTKVYVFNGFAMAEIDALIKSYQPKFVIYETAERVAYLDGAFFWSASK